jgi:hypothetical protein
VVRRFRLGGEKLALETEDEGKDREKLHHERKAIGAR